MNFTMESSKKRYFLHFSEKIGFTHHFRERGKCPQRRAYPACLANFLFRKKPEWAFCAQHSWQKTGFGSKTQSNQVLKWNVHPFGSSSAVSNLSPPSNFQFIHFSFFRNYSYEASISFLGKPFFLFRFILTCHTAT